MIEKWDVQTRFVLHNQAWRLRLSTGLPQPSRRQSYRALDSCKVVRRSISQNAGDQYLGPNLQAILFHRLGRQF